MLTSAQIENMSHRFSKFLCAIAGIDGVISESISFDVAILSPKHESLISAVLEDDDVVLCFDDGEVTIPAREATSTRVESAVKAHVAAAHRRSEMTEKLIKQLATDGFVYVDDLTQEDVNEALLAWSDAYGEDKPDCYLRKSAEGKICGFIKTRLSKEEIAARNDEDGDPGYSPIPMFKAIMAAANK